MRSRYIVAVLLGSVVLAGLVGCNSGPVASPTTSNPAPPTSTAPKSEIANPLGTSKFATDICSGLTDDQVGQYIGGVSKKNPGQSDNGTTCTLLPSDITKATIGIGLTNIPTPTQEALYESDSQLPWRQKISPIAGYPSVDSSTANDSQHGFCVTDSAVNDKQSLEIQFSDLQSSDPYFTKPCTVSEALMAALIQNIQAGGA